MALLSQVVMQFSAADGSVRALAELRAYLTGTTTPTPIYSDPDLLSAISQPVIADSAGIFQELYLDPSIPARIKIIASGGDFATPLIDVNAVNGSATITADDLEAGAVEEHLGYEPVADDGTVSFTAPQRYQFSPDPPAAFHEDDLGYMGSPVVTKNADYTFVLGDTGKFYRKTDGSAHSWTIPPNSSVAFPIGHHIWLDNADAAGVLTIARGVGVALVYAGSTTDANRSIAAGGGGLLVKVGTNSWKIMAPVGVT